MVIRLERKPEGLIFEKRFPGVLKFLKMFLKYSDLAVNIKLSHPKSKISSVSQCSWHGQKRNGNCSALRANNQRNHAEGHTVRIKSSDTTECQNRIAFIQQSTTKPARHCYMVGGTCSCYERSPTHSIEFSLYERLCVPFV